VAAAQTLMKMCDNSRENMKRALELNSHMRDLSGRLDALEDQLAEVCRHMSAERPAPPFSSALRAAPSDCFPENAEPQRRGLGHRGGPDS
jgi:hypothetical protein